MTSDQAKAFCEAATARLIEALEQGHSDALTAYLKMMARFHRYSWGNILLIATQCPGATRVAGFQTWRKLGRYVRRGEKGIVILAPMVRRASEPAESSDDESVRLFGFRAAHVFDVRQTEGAPLSEFAAVTGDPGTATVRLKAFLTRNGVALDYDRSIAPAQGVSQGGRITLLPDLSPPQEFAVLAHESAHELLHRGACRQETTRTSRETEAEAVAYVLCSAIGLETQTSCADYIHLYAGNREILTSSLAAVQHTASALLQAIEEASESAALA
jgi:antirestriction protein ArdC